jgi:hypothetical protein
MNAKLILCAACFVMLLIFSLVDLSWADEFDISVYFDPVSLVRANFEQTSYYNSTLCGLPSWQLDQRLNTYLHAIANNDSALQWWDSMGVTLLCTHYELADFDTVLADANVSFNAINYRWPKRMFQYIA